MSVEEVNKYVIIVAGGSGSRMKSDIPKQFLLLNELPVLMHTIKAFHQADFTLSIIVVLPEQQLSYWQKLSLKYDFTIPHQIVIGGRTRFHSVWNGLQSIKSTSGVVAIHDGVRPLVSSKVILKTFELAVSKGSAVVAVPMKESVRTVEENGANSHLDRSKLWTIQTPQTFKLAVLKEAYSQGYQDFFTDDASVFEAFGEVVNLVEGDYGNIKITTPEDLIFAKAML